MGEQTSVSALLKRYRLAAGLSQEALAAKAGVSARAVSDIERGVHRTPRGATLDLLASALDLAPQRRAMLLAAARPDLTPYPLSLEERGTAAPERAAGFMPRPVTPLVGRAGERAMAAAWAREGARRLLTLTGPGGVGKTHLALQIAADLAGAFPDGRFFVDLAPLGDAGQIPDAIALALGLSVEAASSAAERVSAYLCDRRALLLLDSMERVASGATSIAGLLAHCPQLFILATSRAALRLRAERALPLAPLPPEEAAALFRERAEAARPADAYEEAVVAAICARLDGLPLAIELAAAQVGALPLERLLERLDQRLSALRGGPRDLPDRQRTIEAALDWSYDLLAGEDQAGFRALGVFPSGWTLEAAEAVLASPDALLSLAALVDASLVQLDHSVGGLARWRMLDTTRDYALARLRAAGEEERAMRQFAAHYATMADGGFQPGPGGRGGDVRLDLELPNARAALEWAERRGEAEIGMRLAGFAWGWNARGQAREAVDWMERMLALDGLARAAGEAVAPPRVRVTRLYGLARVLLSYGDPQRAEARLHEALALAQSIQDHGGMAEAFATLGDIAQAEGRLDLAVAAYTASHAHALRAPEDYPAHRALARLGELARLRGDLEQADQYLEQALASAHTSNSQWDVAVIVTLLAHLARERRRYARARAYYQQSLSGFRDFESPTFMAWSLEGLAATLSAEGRHAPAVRLYAGAAALRRAADTPAPPAEREAAEKTLARAQMALGEPRYRAEWAAGSALARDALLAEAMERAADTGVSPAAGGGRGHR
ncbi:MAG TPA: helix-turn-helix domain-containing protein [Ktedonobacterales bacterium]|nr:helix-turn-helix domain-containing protein [Ktedonobacterales bacterium]